MISKSLQAADAFPINLIFEEEGWKIQIGYDQENSIFTCRVNDDAFEDLPYQASIDPEGPQIINDRAVIKLNDVEIKLENNQFSNDDFHQVNRIVNYNQPTTSVYLGEMSSTSSEVANGLFNTIAETVAQNGLLKFEIV